MAFPLLGKVDFAQWTVGELTTSTRGQKSAPVFADSKPSPHIQLTDVAHPMTAPFGASAYNDPEATRLNCELDLSPAQVAQLGKLDEWAKARAKELGLRGEYRPCVGLDKHGNQRVRVKVSTTGVHAARFWDTVRTPLGTAKDLQLQGASIVPIVAVKSLWVMAGMYGLTLELRHAVVTLVQNECPELS